MTIIIADRVHETSNTTGIGTLTLTGAVSAFRPFLSTIGIGNTTYYGLIDGNGIDWEIGIGTVGSGTLDRTTILKSTNSNTAIDLSNSTPHHVFSDAPAAMLQILNDIPTNTILSNINGSNSAPVGNTLSNILDNVFGDVQGSLLYRSNSGWTSLSPGSSIEFLNSGGGNANVSWNTINYSSIPAEVQNSLAQVAIPGVQNVNTKVMILAITQNTRIPANFSGTTGYCFTTATGSFAYTVAYIRSSTSTDIGTITFGTGSHTPILSTQSYLDLVAGDVLYMYTDVSSDATIADVGITLMLLKQ